MPSEIEFQTQIIHAARKQGGHGRKWSSQFQVGVIDLVLSLPVAGVVFMEVKLERINSDKAWNRVVGVTEKQREELYRWEDSGALAVIGIVVDRSARDRQLLLLPPHTERAHSGQQHGPHARGSMPYGGTVDLEFLLGVYKRSLAELEPGAYAALRPPRRQRSWQSESPADGEV